MQQVGDDCGDNNVLRHTQVDGESVDAVLSAHVVTEGLEAFVPPELHARWLVSS